MNYSEDDFDKIATCVPPEAELTPDGWRVAAIGLEAELAYNRPAWVLHRPGHARDGVVVLGRGELLSGTSPTAAYDFFSWPLRLLVRDETGGPAQYGVLTPCRSTPCAWEFETGHELYRVTGVPCEGAVVGPRGEPRLKRVFGGSGDYGTPDLGQLVAAARWCMPRTPIGFARWCGDEATSRPLGGRVDWRAGDTVGAVLDRWRECVGAELQQEAERIRRTLSHGGYDVVVASTCTWSPDDGSGAWTRRVIVDGTALFDLVVRGFAFCAPMRLEAVDRSPGEELWLYGEDDIPGEQALFDWVAELS